MGVVNVAIADDNERMVEILDSIVKKDDTTAPSLVNQISCWIYDQVYCF